MGTAVGDAEPRVKAPQFAELIFFPLGDCDVVNSKDGAVEEVGSSFPQPYDTAGK